MQTLGIRISAPAPRRFPCPCLCAKNASAETNAADSSPGFSRTKANAKSLRVTSASARATTSPCWNASADNAPGPSPLFLRASPCPPVTIITERSHRNSSWTFFKEPSKRPLLAGEEGVRLSLAGAQDKIAVRIESDEISLPLGGAPSTHILKPSIERFAGVVFNESFTMRLAAETGIPAAKVEVRTAETIEYLSVERYDRTHVKSGTTTTLERLHQEDFCQALNIVPEMKYQKEGGPSLKQCFQLVRDVSSAPVVDLTRLLDAVIYNYVIGNNDAHGKNFSLLYQGAGTADQQIRLAPLYDAISTVYYSELSNEMAMKIGDEYRAERVAPRDFDKLAEQAGLAKPLVRRRVPELAQTVLDAAGEGELDQEVAQKVAALIRKRCEATLKRFAN